ncbi:MAG: AAA family ATPase [Patescibacteria group bacterium]|mgnify:FL=1
MPVLSHDQKSALSHILEWYRHDRGSMQYVTLGGYAGTGKTTLIAVMRRELHKIDPGLKVGFVSFTGKAARVLQTKIKEEGVLYRQDSVGTIHSLIYTPILNAREEIVGWKTKDEIDRNLIIVDEGSMVDATIWEHLISYRVPMIVVGDHGQLPPIKGNFTLMQTPHVRLEEIHRQAKKNPIIALSITARQSGAIAPGRYGKTVVKYGRDSSETGEVMQEMLTNYQAETLILCGYNKTRKKLNAYIRAALGFETTEPSVGDRVICLRNNHRAKIYNGMLGTITKIMKMNERSYSADIDIDGEDETYSGLIATDQFDADTALNFTENRSRYHGIDLFDFGYALTVHKAQGSQAKRVILFEERFGRMTDDEWRRWLYTAVTRAEEELYIFPSP